MKERVKPVVQGTLEFMDTVIWDIDKLVELKEAISIDVRKIKPGADITKLEKPWIQNMVEQIILFYKVVIFHQDCVRMVLTLINEIAMVDDSRIDAIIEVLGPKAKAELKVDGRDRGISDGKKGDKNYEEIKGETNVQDTEKAAQQTRRVRSFINTRRIRLLYYLLYNRYRISENDLVKIDKDHPMSLFLEHFNKFISNKMAMFVKTPLKSTPKDPAGELKILRNSLVGEGPLSEWEKMYLMSVLMSRNAEAGGLNRMIKNAPKGGFGGILGFGSNKELKKEYRMLEREIYEFSLERCLMILYDSGFKLDQGSMKRFVDQYQVAQEMSVPGEKRTVSQKAEDFITQMQAAVRIFKRGLFKRPIAQYKQGEKVFEYILEDSYMLRPMALLKTVPDYPEWTRKIAEILDHKNYLVSQCGKLNVACMPELSLGRTMYFVMTHLLLINRVLMRLASERIIAGRNSYKYTKRKSQTEALFKLQDWSPDKKRAKRLFDPARAAHEPRTSQVPVST